MNTTSYSSCLLLIFINNKFRDAEKSIDKWRELLDPKIKSLMRESYKRVYPLILELQYLKELEEIIEYK